MRQFHEIFRGRDDVYGTYRMPEGVERVDGEKFLGKGRTIHSALTQQQWDDHLAGKDAIGVIPILPDNTCWWFAIDVDRYDQPNQHVELEKKIQRHSLPLVVTLSKSNGTHLWCCLTRPISARKAREAAEKYCKLLGLGKVEIFPKQDQLRKGDDGNWINLPYFGNTRLGIGPNGDTLDLEGFLQLVHAREISPVDLGEAVGQAQRASVQGEHAGAPPCIQTMFRDGIEEGGRDDRLLHIGVYLKQAFPDDWSERLFSVNEEKCNPPMKASEVARIVSSLERKEYHYKCKALQDICEKKVCLTREFGVGTGDHDYIDVVIDRLQKINSEPPVWIVTINGTPAKLSTDQLIHPEQFRKAVVEKFNRLIPPMSKQSWEKYLSNLFEKVEIEEAPHDISAPGQVWQIFLDWTSRMVKSAKTIERIADGYPFFIQEENLLVFRGVDLLAQCQRAGIVKLDPKVAWATLREEGAEVDRRYIDGKLYRLWKLRVAAPWFQLPTKADAF